MNIYLHLSKLEFRSMDNYLCLPNIAITDIRS